MCLYAVWVDNLTLIINISGTFAVGHTGWLKSGNSYTVKCVATFPDGTSSDVEARWFVLEGEECISNYSKFISSLIGGTTRTMAGNSGMSGRVIKIQAKYTYNGATYETPVTNYNIMQ